MRIESAVALSEGRTRQAASADLIIGVTVDEVDEAVAIWTPYREAQEKATGKRSQHSHWDWSRKARAIQGGANYSIIGVRVGVEMQGLLLWDDLFEKARHRDQLGRDLVYVHFVSTAPWNDRDIVNDPRYVGTGTLLVQTAVERSADLGYKGRLGLHALTQAEPFYRDRCKMADLGPDNSGSHKGLRYFEFTPTMAAEFFETNRRNTMTQQQKERSAQMLADLEDGCSVTAGSLDVEAFYRKVEDTKAQATHGREPLLSVFSRVVNMARRDHGWSIEQLADKADVEAIEVFRIEEDLAEPPEPRVVSSLSRALRLPAGKMMQLVGHITVLDPKVSGAAMKFAASSGSMEKLTRTEKVALNDFVKALAEE